MFEVRATSGDTHLGGEDFDQRIIKYCISQVGPFLFVWRPSGNTSSDTHRHDQRFAQNAEMHAARGQPTYYPPTDNTLCFRAPPL